MIRILFYFWTLNGEDRKQKNEESLNTRIKRRHCSGKDASLQMAEGEAKIMAHCPPPPDGRSL